MQTNQPIGYGTQQSGATHTPTHVWDYWAIVMKRILLVLLFCGVSMGLALFLTQRQQKLYRSTAVVQILPPRMSGPSDTMFTPMIVNDEAYLATQLMILQTRETIEKAIVDSRLEDKPDFKGKSRGEIVQMAYGHIDCNRQRGLYLVNVSVTGPDPKVLDDLANALVLTFKESQRSESKRAREERRTHLEDKRQSADSLIRLRGLDKKNALQNANFSPETYEFEWRKIQEGRDRLSMQDDLVYSDILRDEPIVAAFKLARQDPAKGLVSLATHPAILLHEGVKEVDRRIANLKDQENVLIRDNIGLEHPKMVALRDALEAIARERGRVIEEFADTFLLKHANNVAFHDSLQKQIERRTQEMKAAVAVKSEVDRIEDEIELLKANKDAATRDLEIVLANASYEKDAVQIQSTATTPDVPYAPNSGTNLMLGFVVGIVGGVALAFLLDYLDDTIRTKDELAKIAPEVPLLGVVPTIEARKAEVSKKDLFAANQPKSTISEAYRGVRTALTLSARGPLQKVMLLTSAGPREGKTTTAINLATVLAFSGARTLIIDADLRKPRIHASFGLPNTKGLTNLIVGEDDPADFCQRTQLERVDVMTSGPIPPNPSELLGRPRMREILRKLRERYDQVIIDTPPIGAVTDAAVLATMVDGVVLVVHAGKTRRQIVSRSIEQLRYINVPIIGVILNNLHLGRGRYYPGYYHYYYYYSSHYGTDDVKAKKGKTPAASAKTSETNGPNPD